MKRIAILASGTGSNAENIARQFEGDKHIAVDILLCDREEAPVLEKMKRFGIPTQIFPRTDWRSNPQPILELLQNRNIDLIVLAGFTSFIPDCIVKAYERRIINLHPSLLPKFGGKGMWGMNVHRAVIEAESPSTTFPRKWTEEKSSHSSAAKLRPTTHLKHSWHVSTHSSTVICRKSSASSLKNN